MSVKLFFKNIQIFPYLCRSDLFQVVYLREGQNMGAVVQCIHALGRKAQNNGWQGPQLGPKEAQKNERLFTQEQLNQGRIAGIH